MNLNVAQTKLMFVLCNITSLLRFILRKALIAVSLYWIGFLASIHCRMDGCNSLATSPMFPTAFNIACNISMSDGLVTLQLLVSMNFLILSRVTSTAFYNRHQHKYELNHYYEKVIDSKLN